MKSNMSSLEDSITTSTKQIKKEVQHLVEEMVDKERPLINVEKDPKTKSNKPVPLSVVGPVFV